MISLTNYLTTPNFIVCYGFIGPNQPFDVILRGDGQRHEWVYGLFASLDDLTPRSGTYTVKDPVNNQDTTIVMNNGQAINFRQYFDRKVIGNNQNNIVYYFAFNPIPSTDVHDFETTNTDVFLNIIDKKRYIIPIIGSCTVNGVLIEQLKYCTIDRFKTADVKVSPNSTIAIITKMN